jgi:hypothetical protein
LAWQVVDGRRTTDFLDPSRLSHLPFSCEPLGDVAKNGAAREEDVHLAGEFIVIMLVENLGE